MDFSTRENEGTLLQQAKEFSQELDRQKVELEKADNFPESSNSEVSKLRQQLLKHHNDLAQAEERQYQLDYKIEWYILFLLSYFLRIMISKFVMAISYTNAMRYNFTSKESKSDFLFEEAYNLYKTYTAIMRSMHYVSALYL